jgi:hypothetical protein
MPTSENVDFGIDGQHDGSHDAQMKRFFEIIDDQRPESWQYHPDEELSSFYGHQSTSAKAVPPTEDEKGIFVARPYLRKGADQQQVPKLLERMTHGAGTLTTRLTKSTTDLLRKVSSKKGYSHGS